jgi:phytol kinase
VLLETILLITSLLLAWNLFVIHILTKWVYTYMTRYKDIPADYVSRKFVHIFGAGITAILIPIFYESHYELAIIATYAIAIYLLIKRKYQPMDWFLTKENRYEVHFAFAFGTILLVGVLLNNLLVGLIPILFMSFGDSATGLLRAITQKKHIKSWEGSAAMFIICSIIGFIFLGLYGIAVAAIATLAEKIPKIDDNITIPLTTGLLVYLQTFLI